MKPATVRGQVSEMMPNQIYRVELYDDNATLDGKRREILCHLSGKIRLNKIKVLVGDKVEVVLDPYGGKTSNRITRRL